MAPRIQTYTYNQHGQVLTATDARGKTTSYAYYTDTAFTGTDPNAVGHTLGDLKTVTNAAGHVTQYTQYDKAGRLLQSIDPNGVTTTNAYTARGWLAGTTVSPSGGGAATQTSYDYWPSGQLKRVTQADASYVEYSYDDAQRLVAIHDNLGNRIDYTLDNAGKRTAEQVKDAGGVLARRLSRVMDALGRTQQTTGRE